MIPVACMHKFEDNRHGRSPPHPAFSRKQTEEFMLYDYTKDPRSWYSKSKCGCVVTSSRHPSVRNQTSLPGYYVDICESHRSRPAENKKDRPFAWYRQTDGDQEPEFRTSEPPEGHGWLPVPAKRSEITAHQQANKSYEG